MEPLSLIYQYSTLTLNTVVLVIARAILTVLSTYPINLVILLFIVFLLGIKFLQHALRVREEREEPKQMGKAIDKVKIISEIK